VQRHGFLAGTPGIEVTADLQRLPYIRGMARGARLAQRDARHG